MTANNVSISDVAPQITDTPKNLNFTPATGSSTKPTKPVGKENTKQPNNKRSDDDDGDDEDFDGWLGHNPMPDPSDYDSDGDGKVDLAVSNTGSVATFRNTSTSGNITF
jgi:hypothetical protein